MQDPAREITSVISNITSSNTPDIQQATVTKYFTEDAGFHNPFCFIKPGPLSREDVLGVYQWYRILSPDVELRVENIIHDKDTLVLDIQHRFHIRLSPFKSVPARFLTRFKLSKKDGLYYICYQEDFFHPDEIFNLLVPPVVPVIRFFLSATGVLSTVSAKLAQVFGIWRTEKGPGGVVDLSPEQQTPPASESSADSEEPLVKHTGHKMNHVKEEQIRNVESLSRNEDRTQGVERNQRHNWERDHGHRDDHGRRERVHGGGQGSPSHTRHKSAQP